MFGELLGVGTHTETREQLAVWRFAAGYAITELTQLRPPAHPAAVAVSPAVGRYRHYKGGLYTVLGVAAGPDGTPLVIYRPDEDPARIWLRDADMFCEQVLIDGAEQPRFLAL